MMRGLEFPFTDVILMVGTNTTEIKGLRFARKIMAEDQTPAESVPHEIILVFNKDS